jgi:hypothetical protein
VVREQGYWCVVRERGYWCVEREQGYWCVAARTGDVERERGCWYVADHCAEESGFIGVLLVITRFYNTNI